MQFLARRYDTGEWAEFQIDGPRIGSVRPAAAPRDGRPQRWIAPALVDLQSNGYGGQEFSSASLTVEKVAKIARQHERFGVSRFLPTVTTASFEVLAQSMRTLADACRQSPAVARRVAGIHLEGPYFSVEDGPRGAHAREQIRPPDWDEFQRLQQAADGRIRLITLSPEYPQAPEFIARAVAAGVRVAIGHTSADGPQIRAAADAGATLSTHLGNGAHRLLPRHPNYLWDQLADDRLTATLIVDGHHLPPEVVKCMVRCKTPERCILVSDLSGLAGLPTGHHRGELCDVEILPDGRLVLAGQTQFLAGAGRPIDAGVANAVRFAGVSLRTAIDMASRQPAAMLGLPPVELSAGQPADLILFDFDAAASPESEGLQLRTVLLDGEPLELIRERRSELALTYFANDERRRF